MRVLSKSVPLLTLFLLGLFGSVQAQPRAYDPTPETIQYIYDNRDAYVGRDVRLPVPVTVESKNVASNRTTRSFTVTGPGGTGIEVYTTEQLPETGRKYRVSGPVELEDGSQTPYIAPPAQIEPVSSIPDWLKYAIGGLLVAIGALGAYLIIQRSSSSQEEPRQAAAGEPAGGGPQAGRGPQEGTTYQTTSGPTRETGPDTATPPGDGTTEGEDEGEVHEGETVKIETPPPKTVKMLGRLEVISGHDDPEIPLLAPISDGEASPAAGHEFTIGRRSASDENRFSHIQVKPRTVSREQAKLSFVNGSFRLTNYVSERKNPTMVNGTPLDRGEQVELSDGDTITMGEVKLRLHTGAP